MGLIFENVDICDAITKSDQFATSTKFVMVFLMLSTPCEFSQEIHSSPEKFIKLGFKPSSSASFYWHIFKVPIHWDADMFSSTIILPFSLLSKLKSVVTSSFLDSAENLQMAPVPAVWCPPFRLVDIFGPFRWQRAGSIPPAGRGTRTQDLADSALTKNMV